MHRPPRFTPFGKYLLLDRIATGGMAEVYLAKAFEDGRPGDLMAIKRILPALAADAEFIRMFLDEAKIAGRLAHPSIVRIRELGRVGASHYLAMDFVWGKDLIQIMRRCRALGTQLSAAFVAWVGVGICEALEHAHEKKDPQGRAMGIIHRDVSPQNVLVSFDGKVQLIDFGIAKATTRTSHTQAGVLKGKVGYMSPEQVRGETIDARADLFTVGTCLYELLTLRSLFARDNAYEAMEGVRSARAEPIREHRPDVSVELEQVLAKALSRSREERWQSARELREALAACVAQADPEFDRVAGVRWLRDAFAKELHAERARLDAFDQLGRPQLAPIDAPARTSVTDLEIAIARAPDWDDDDAETQVFDEPIPFIDSQPPDEPSEVFFANDAPSVGGAADDVALAGSQIDSGVIERLLPAPDEKAKAAREPTARVRHERDDEPPPRTPRIALRVVGALLLLVLGAAGAYGYLMLEGDARIEVRTTPDVNAIVLLDGAARGHAPLALENVPPGRHVVTVVAEGYEDARREVDVGPNGVASLDIVLARAP